MKISIIVCTFNRSYAIAGCLNSIAAALSNAAPIEAEIIVVDNASTDDTSAVVKKWAETCDFSVQVLYEPKKGLSAARNCGMRAARGELLAFTDDDCKLSKTYITDALRHDAADTEPVFRGGRINLGNPDDLPITIKTDEEKSRWSLKENSAKYTCLGNCIFGCNMLIRRSVAEKLGFFDERMGAGTALPAGEDLDYVIRAYLENITIEYVPDMAVYHYHGRKTANEGYKLFKNYMIGQGAIYAKYLFKDYNMCRQFWWDFKDAIREIITGKNTFKPANIGLSYKLKIAYCLLGSVKYLSYAALRALKGDTRARN